MPGVYPAALLPLRYFDYGRVGVFLPHSADSSSEQRRAFDPELPIHLERSGRLFFVVFPHASELPLSAEPGSSPLTAKLEGPMVVEHIPEFDVADYAQSKRAFRNCRSCLPIHFDPLPKLERFLCGMHYCRQTDLRSDNFISCIPVQSLDTGLAEGGSNERVGLARIGNMNINIPDSILRQKHGALVVQYPQFVACIQGFDFNGDPGSLLADKGSDLRLNRSYCPYGNEDSKNSNPRQGCADPKRSFVVKILGLGLHDPYIGLNVFLGLGLEARAADLLLRRGSDLGRWMPAVLSVPRIVRLGISLEHDQSERRCRQYFPHDSEIVPLPPNFKLGHHLDGHRLALASQKVICNRGLLIGWGRRVRFFVREEQKTRFC